MVYTTILKDNIELRIIIRGKFLRVIDTYIITFIYYVIKICYYQVTQDLVLSSLIDYSTYTYNLSKPWSMVTLIKNRLKIGFSLKTLSAIILS